MRTMQPPPAVPEVVATARPAAAQQTDYLMLPALPHYETPKEEMGGLGIKAFAPTLWWRGLRNGACRVCTD
jgi:hypothetical protein